MPDTPLKLFVWTAIFTDYTDGLAVAIAEDRKQAIELIVQSARAKERYEPELDPEGEIDSGDGIHWIRKQLEGHQPEVRDVATPFGVYVH